MRPAIRHATHDDLGRINEIYNAYIVDRPTSFDADPWTVDERAEWFAKYRTTGRYQILLLEYEGVVVGFAASSPFRDKKGYDSSVETTIVLDEAVLGRGWGSLLLTALIERLNGEDIHRVYALITLPNPASVVVHERQGYRSVGILDEVGYKLDEYHSVLIMELRLES